MSESDREPTWRRYLRFWGQNVDADIDDELRFHIEMRAAEAIRRGASAEEARQAALARFGHVDVIRRDCARIGHDRSRHERRRAAAADLGQDIAYALRVLRRQRLPAVVIVLCLALGIGATTTVFSVGDALLLRPPPFPNGSRLVSVGTVRQGSGGMRVSSFEDFSDWRAHQRTFEALGAVQRATLTIAADQGAMLASGASVTSDVFRALGVRPVYGRLLAASDDEPNAPAVAVVSVPFADRVLGGADRAVGSMLRVDQRPIEIVGVLEAASAYPEGLDVWLSMPRAPDPNQRDSRSLDLIGALRDGVSIEAARRDLVAIAAQVAREVPGADSTISVAVIPLRERYVGAARPAFAAIVAASVFLLLIACANVASLQLARGTARVREIAIRTALGASRGRILRLLLTESVVLAMVGGALGVAVATGTARVVAAAIPANAAPWMAPGIDARVLSFTLLVSMLSGILFGLVPALRLTSPAPARLAQDSARAGGDPRRLLLQRGLVALEMALSLVLVVGATLAARSFARLTTVDPGFDPHDVMTMRLTMSGPRYDEDAGRVQLVHDLVRELAALPGVEAAAATSHAPIADCCSRFGLAVEGQPQDRSSERLVTGSVVTPDYFQALRIGLVRGRVFTDDDRANGQPVVVINESFERELFGGQPAVGRIVHQGSTDALVIGVVRDVKQVSLTDAPEPQIYFPQSQKAWERVTLTVRAPQGMASTLVPQAREILKRLDPSLALYRAAPLTQLMENAVAAERMFRTLLQGFAAVALVLAMAGIYGVTAYWVAQRLPEMGIRLALGARPRAIFGLVVRQGAILTVIGTAIGLLSAYWAARVLARMLYGVTATDPLVYVVGAGVLLVTAVVACAGPARRATAVDPMVSLRSD